MFNDMFSSCFEYWRMPSIARLQYWSLFESDLFAQLDGGVPLDVSEAFRPPDRNNLLGRVRQSQGHDTLISSLTEVHSTSVASRCVRTPVLTLMVLRRPALNERQNIFNVERAQQ